MIHGFCLWHPTLLCHNLSCSGLSSVNSFDPTTNSSVWLTDCNFQYNFYIYLLFSYKCKVFILQNYFILVIFLFFVFVGGIRSLQFASPDLLWVDQCTYQSSNQCTPRNVNLSSESLVSLSISSISFGVLGISVPKFSGALVLHQWLNIIQGIIVAPSNSSPCESLVDVSWLLGKEFRYSLSTSTKLLSMNIFLLTSQTLQDSSGTSCCPIKPCDVRSEENHS
jgi:hypothetical protein